MKSKVFGTCQNPQDASCVHDFLSAHILSSSKCNKWMQGLFVLCIVMKFSREISPCAGQRVPEKRIAQRRGIPSCLFLAITAVVLLPWILNTQKIRNSVCLALRCVTRVSCAHYLSSHS